MTELPERPWTEVSIDFSGPFPSGEYLLVAIDSYSRYPEVEILKSISADSVIPKLDAIFARHGIPDIVKSDNGPPFNGRDFNNFADSLGFRHRKVTPLWPQANGGVERVIPMLTKTMQAAKIEKKPWKQELSKFLRNYRATPHSMTGVSPAEALFGRKIKVKLPEIYLSKPNNTHLDNKIRTNDSLNKKKIKAYADKKRRATMPDIRVGDTVLCRQRRQNKMMTFYSPRKLKVKDCKGSMITASDGGQHITRNSSFFKKIPSSRFSDDDIEDLHDETYSHPTPAPEENDMAIPPMSPRQPEVEEVINPRRSTRPRKRPGYLDDYVV